MAFVLFERSVLRQETPPFSTNVANKWSMVHIRHHETKILVYEDPVKHVPDKFSPLKANFASR